jgi:hypothetical protein
MYKLQRLCRPTERLVWEQHPSMLASQAHFTNLVHM